MSLIIASVLASSSLSGTRGIFAAIARTAPMPPSTMPVARPDASRTTDPFGKIGRVRRAVANAERLEAAAVQVGAVVGLLDRDRVIRDDAIELLARELRAAVGKLIHRPAADGVDPVARRNRLRARGKQAERLLPRFHAVEPHLACPRRARAQQVHVVVDQPGHHGASAQIDAPRRRTAQLRDLLIGPHRDHADRP